MKKDDLPFMPWSWGDWFKATDVQALPRNIRCTWFEMIGRMWECSPRGYLLINGMVPTDEEYAQMLGFGGDIPGVKATLNHLLSRGICSKRENDGALFCRRIVNFDANRQVFVNFGKKGGNPLLKDNPPLNPSLNPPLIPGGYPSLKNKNKDKSEDKDGDEDSQERGPGETAEPKRFVKPTIAQITVYCQIRKNSVNPQRFFDFYESKGWKIGRNSMKDWQAAVRTWEQKDREEAGRIPAGASRFGPQPFTPEVARRQAEILKDLPGGD